ncbi:hypothetical protein [Embleya sp. NPDC005971]|uniref:hypothetical protein n=1 Tax=Embleya sp. NPDC005971 TaxID=3156724 RepID=UPI0033F57167
MNKPPLTDVPAHIPTELHSAFRRDYARTAAVPGHAPYRVGDSVQLHGYAGHLGHPEDHAATGFRGWVAGSIGATILTGITTTGRPWAEPWGGLHPDGLPVDIWDHCACCRHLRLPLLRAHYAALARTPTQLDLFAQARP